MKLLLIDDNPSLGDSLSDFLGDNWQVTLSANGDDGSKLAVSGGFDVIILDLNLPDISGQTVCRMIRRAGVRAPILVLSGTIDADSKVNLLKLGADDYVTKPFDSQELQARLQALLRRGHLDPAAAYLLKIDDLVLDPHTRNVARAGQKVTLRRKEFDVLEYLLRNKGRVVTRNMIMDTVWGADSDSWNNTVDVHIKSLRDKVDRPFERPLISTAYGIGYTIREGHSQQLTNQERSQS